MGHISESTLRSKAQRLGYRVMKSRDRRTHANNSGGFMLVNASQNFVVAGERYDLTLGDVYVAHALSLATRKKPDAIFALHKSGKSWAQIAKSHNVSLKGSSELIKEMERQ